MNREEAEYHPTLEVEAPGLDVVIRSIAEQFKVVMGKPERVAEGCNLLKFRLSHPPNASQTDPLQVLLPLLAEHSWPLAEPLFDLFEEVARTSHDPWPFLQGLLASADDDGARRSLDLLLERIHDGGLGVDRRMIRYLADLCEIPGKPIGRADRLPGLASIVRSFSSAETTFATDPALALFLTEQAGSVRRLAARILDLDGEPVSMGRAERILGQEALVFLAPYLAYTRTTHLDLLSMLPWPGEIPPFLPSLRSAEAVLGEALLREIIADLGWSRINLGLDVRPCTRVTVGNLLPLFLSPSEAALFERCGSARRSGDSFLVVAHGTAPSEGRETTRLTDPATRFRNYNLAHAEVLGDFLAVEPLTRAKVRLMLERMDRIVEDFTALFADFSEECSILPAVYGELKRRIEAALSEQADEGPLSAELTRLVMTFEDPPSLGRTQTLHGLKRYLHQKGLQLGFKLVLRSRSTNRTVDLVLASKERILHKLQNIRYSDFEPEDESGGRSTRMPYAVALAVDSLGVQMLYGQESFPRLDIFCYGSEVHYYLAFGNHPAFLRINFAPPLQGGMIDLEYYGVSKYELSVHPDLSLDALRRFFQRLEFDIQIDNTRVRARYDKEQAHDLGSLRDRAAWLFCLAPYLLEIDWTIGGLALPAEARRAVADAWAETFASWGVLPLRYLLTEDRQGIVESVEPTAVGKREVTWSGIGPYRGRFAGGFPADFLARLSEELERLGIGFPESRSDAGFGRLQLERRLLEPLRQAVRGGELQETADGFVRTPEIVQRVHEAELFAELLGEDDSVVRSAAEVAAVVSPLERILQFTTTGSVLGYDVQSARLPLKGETLGIYVLRGAANMVRLALVARGAALFRRRADRGEEWVSNEMRGAGELAALLRAAHYPVPGLEQLPHVFDADVQRLRRDLVEAHPAQPRKPVPGERIVHGLRASPGRVVGRVIFGTAGHSPDEFDDAVLVAASIRPEDNAYLYHAGGIVSTGGGILSHAGLLATQFRKPALIIEGRWELPQDRPPKLHYRTLEYEAREAIIRGYPVSMRDRLREREHELLEGDLVVLDAGEGTLRVLGQDRDTLALHEAFFQFGRAAAGLARSTGERDVLTFRGRLLRARHQIEKILTRLTDPVLACHAVHELLLGSFLIGSNVRTEEKAALIERALRNAHVGPTAGDHLRWIMDELQRRFETMCDKARRLIPASPSVFEIIQVRLDVLRTARSRTEAAACLRACGIAVPTPDANPVAEIDGLSLHRLCELRLQVLSVLGAVSGSSASPDVRHLLRRLERIEALTVRSEPLAHALRERIAEIDRLRNETLSERWIVGPEDGGWELHDLVGWKAANLAEAGRIMGSELIPPWFAVTDRAFRTILDGPLEDFVTRGPDIPESARCLGDVIESVLQQTRLDNAQKSARIRALWESVNLPEALVNEIVTAYRRLNVPLDEHQRAEDEPYVAIRSSSHEEDAEVAARAGEFDTFLFIRGEQTVLDYLKRTWSGLWSERAIHNRAVLGTTADAAGGGVIVQRIVHSRVSGVLQTVNVARNESREIVINAGLGLGEGIVSGTVSADQIVVSKEGEPTTGPLRFNYVTADKRERVVFNRRTGLGTVRVEALYHQRLRPALEYVELCELVAAAVRLENIYGYPLDMEFGIEGTRLWILQVRPVPTFLAAIQETQQHYPLAEPCGYSQGEHHDQA